MKFCHQKWPFEMYSTANNGEASVQIWGTFYSSVPSIEFNGQMQNQALAIRHLLYLHFMLNYKIHSVVIDVRWIIYNVPFTIRVYGVPGPIHYSGLLTYHAVRSPFYHNNNEQWTTSVQIRILNMFNSFLLNANRKSQMALHPWQSFPIHNWQIYFDLYLLFIRYFWHILKLIHKSFSLLYFSAQFIYCRFERVSTTASILNSKRIKSALSKFI